MQKNRQFLYYNNDMYNEISALKKEKKYYETLDAYRKYVEIYPYDTTAVIMLASFAMDLGFIEEAENLVNNITITKNTYNFDEIVYAKIKLLCCQGKFEECYKLLQENYSLLYNKRKDFYSILLYLQKKLGLPINIDIEKYSYTMKQILNYDEGRAIHHIGQHKSINEDENNRFKNSFSIEDYYYYFRHILPLKDYPRLFNGIFKNIYIFKYEDNGFNNKGKSLDYIQVVTLQDSNQIITMYPFSNKENYPYIDITPKKEEEKTSNVLVKRLSQIEKFNQRYGKNIDNN